jgi:thiamine-monophosphate kinase
MTPHVGLGAGPEFDRIRAIAQVLGERAAPLGDDCAVIPLGGTNVVASVDCSVEGVHFRTDWLTFEEIGWRSTSAALSDLAAEGAGVIGVMVSVGVPQGVKREKGNVDSVVELMKGVGAAVASVGGKVLGGDLVRSDKWLVDVTALGTANRPVTREGARAGDGMWVTGTFGGAGLALDGLRRKTVLAAGLRARYAHPEPRISAGLWLAAHGARAMVDVSDGLAADVGHLAAASKVEISLTLQAIPCWPGVAAPAALESGEEFELAVVLPAAFGEAESAAFVREVGLPLTRIGECRMGSGVRVHDRGRVVPTPSGFDHFAPR